MPNVLRVYAGAGVLLAALWLPGSAAAQPGASAGPARVEIWGAGAIGKPAGDSTLDVAYAPPMRLGGTPLESRASQTLNVESSTGHGIDAGVNLFFSRVFGVQAAFSSVSADVGGANGDFRASLRYISRPPPDYQPRDSTYERSSPWDDTAGTLRRRSVSFGGVARWGVGRPMGGTVAGGVDIACLTGEIESAGYQQFVLGGHSTLFPVMHRVRVRPAEGERLYSPYVGADVHVALSRWAAIMAGTRVRLGTSRAVPVEVVDLVDPDEDSWVPEIADVASAFDGHSLDVPGTSWHAFVGLKIFLR